MKPQPAVVRFRDGAVAVDYEQSIDGLIVPAGVAPNDVLAQHSLRILGALSTNGRLDFISYLQIRGIFWVDRERPSPECYRVNLTSPLVVGGYVSSPWLGQFVARQGNLRNAQRGIRPQPIRRVAVTVEDLMTLQNRTSFEARTHPHASEARTKFAEATRTASFSLSLGVREIRLLAEQPWLSVQWLQADSVAAMQRLIDKGLLIHEQGRPPRLSEAGELMRQLLVISRHIVEAEPAAPTDTIVL